MHGWLCCSRTPHPSGAWGSSGRPFTLRRTFTMARTASLSGFPEWLPEERLVELHVLDTLRRTFELHGFSSIETRAVETVGQLLRKGEIDKEVYGLSRLQDEEDATPKTDHHALALHFDLTVPFA